MFMAFLHQIRVALFSFWPIWLSMTTAALIYVACVIGWTVAPMAQRTRVEYEARRQVGSGGAVAALTLLAFFLAGYIAMILVWENFTYHDNSIFTLYTLRGHDIGLPIMPAIGRFFPLGFQEFNLIRHFTNTITGYHALRIVQLLIFSWILLILNQDLSFRARVSLVILTLITPSILTSFSWLIYHEANVLFFIVCLALFVKRFEQTGSVGWAAAGVVCAQIMIYYKETASLLVLGFAVSRLALRCRRTNQTGWDYTRLWDKDSRLDLCLACLGVMFWFYYLAVMFPHPNIQYAEDIRRPLSELLLGYLKVDLLALLFVGTVLFRTYLIVRRKVVPSLLWDGLAFGGVACFVGYLGLGISTAYYLAPVDLIALLFVGRLTVLSGQNMPSWAKLGTLILLITVALQDISLSAFRVLEQKNVIHAKGEIARVVHGHYQNSTGQPRRLFFPFASPYMIMELASYLDYRGVPVEGLTAETGGLNVIVVARAVMRDDQCVPYRRLICHAGTTPDPGDLVLVLPDDNVSLADVTPYQAEGELLFSYEPAIPQWLYPFISTLRIISPGALAQKELRDGWLYASVTAWR
jgi:hypothetical protein